MREGKYFTVDSRESKRFDHAANHAREFQLNDGTLITFVVYGIHNGKEKIAVEVDASDHNCTVLYDVVRNDSIDYMYTYVLYGGHVLTFKKIGQVRYAVEWKDREGAATG